MGWMSLLDENQNEVGICGDGPWDIMGKAIDDIIALFEKEWHRKPTIVELEHTFQFCMGGLVLEGEESDL